MSGQQKFHKFISKCFGASRVGNALQCLGVLIPLMIVSGTQAMAFPNVGINLQQAIQKQDNALNKNNEADGFKFGILGSVEFKSINHRFHSDWQGVLARIEDETEVYDRCSASLADCTPKVRKWRTLLQDLKGLPVKEQLSRLNKSINRMATYADDDKTFGKKDHWATPLEFLNGKADCEDYAAVKFWSLLELGYGNDHLRMAIVRDQRRGIMHAVVTVETDYGTIILDSLFDHPVEQRHILKYAPIYSANLDDNWVHIVTRKIRVSYINSLTDGVRGRVVPVKLQKQIRPMVRPVGGLIGLAALKTPSFIDWT